MSGVEALALVTGVMTVITFAVDTAKACKAIYDNKSMDDDLQARAMALRAAAEAVRRRCSSWRPQSVDEQKLGDLARGCEEAAADLLKEIKTLSRRSSAFSTWTTPFKPAWKLHKLHKMEKRLDDYKDTLQTGLLVRLCSNVEVALLQQTHDFRHLHDDFKQVLSQIVESHIKLTTVLATEHAKTRDHALQSIQDAQASTTHEIRKVLAAAATEEQRKQLLQSLKYAQMNDRRNRIDNTHDGTFHWVLQPRQRKPSEKTDPVADSESTEEEPVCKEHESDWRSISSTSSGEANDDPLSDLKPHANEHEHCQDNNSGDDPSELYHSSSKSTELWPLSPEASALECFDNFVEWLRSDQSMYWIQGKPGSGKSTLMKYIVASPITLGALVHWRPDTQILSHYFWKVGGGDQCTIKGFWCSLIHQILVLGPEELVDYVLEKITQAKLKNDTSDWSLEELEKTCFTILGRKTEPTCIFIDGMDEIVDKCGIKALEVAITNISSKAPAGVKFCLSSRPEYRFETWLGQLPTLELHKLTHDDMLRFVADKIQADQAVSETLSERTAAEVRRMLVGKAEGVFLWLALATESVIRGISQHDSDREIFERIDHLPSELDQLYSEMWRRANGELAVYHKEAARFLNLVVMHRRLGLNEHLTIKGITLTTKFDKYRGTLDWLVADGERAWQEIEPKYSKTERDMRIRCAGLLDFAGPPELRWVTFIHRTAYDYLIDTPEGQAILGYGSVSLMDKVADVLLAIWTSMFAWRMHGVDISGSTAASQLGQLLFNNEGEDGYEAVPDLVQLYFELEHTWGWRYAPKASDQTTSAACPLRFPLYWLLRYGDPNTTGQAEMRTKFCALEALRKFPDASRTATFALIDLASSISYRDRLVSGLHGWDTQSFQPMALHLLESGADVTAVISIPYRRWFPFLEDDRYKRGSSILERLVITVHVGQWGSFDRYGKSAVLDIIAKVSSAEGLSRTTLAVFDLLNNGWLSADSYYEWMPQMEGPHTLRVALILRINLMHIVQLSALDGADEDSATVFEQLLRRYSPVLDEPVQLVGIYIGLRPTGLSETSQCYRVRALPSMSCLLALEDVLQLTSTEFPPGMTEACLYRRARACIRDGVRQGALEKMKDLSELMVQEGVLTIT